MRAELVLCLAVALGGAMAVSVACVRGRRDTADLDLFLEGVAPPAAGMLSAPLVTRMANGAMRAVGRRIEHALPRHYLAKIDRQLARAGLTGQRRAGEQLAIQLVFAAAGMAVTVLLLAAHPSRTVGLTLLALPAMAFVWPDAKLKRTIRSRDDKIFKDLPDIVDMLAIAVEAGSGFEAALSLVCTHFDSPLTEEFAIALHEMELGLSRREALQQLRERTSLDPVRNLVLALLQADALGVPIGRVLKGQAAEVRSRRRAWAREKAAKLPVKILFPLTLFIFPPILGLVLGPAAMSFVKMGGG
jgi:tight adherence protein C